MIVKYVRLWVRVMLFASMPLYSVNIPEKLAWCGSQIATYSQNLMTDTPTQAVTAGSVLASVACYQQYHYHAALACLDGHPNSYIMHKSKLIYVPYYRFIEILESLHSYSGTLEFVDQYCRVCCMLSQEKINKFIMLAHDLQVHNKKCLTVDTTHENMVLENFKNNLVNMQANIKQQIMNDAINANKNAHTMYAVSAFLDIITTLFGK